MKGIKPTLMATMLAFLSISTTACATESQMRASMNIQNTTLWQLIEALTVPPLFLPDTIKRVFPVEFSERGNNGYFSFHEGGPLHLADQVLIKKVTVSIKNADGVIRSLVLNLAPSGACVTRRDLHAHYPNTEITGAPRGGSLDEETVWTVLEPWARLSFGFKEKNPDCLATVGIGRNDPFPTPPSP